MPSVDIAGPKAPPVVFAFSLSNIHLDNLSEWALGITGRAARNHPYSAKYTNPQVVAGAQWLVGAVSFASATAPLPSEVGLAVRVSYGRWIPGKHRILPATGATGFPHGQSGVAAFVDYLTIVGFGESGVNRSFVDVAWYGIRNRKIQRLLAGYTSEGRMVLPSSVRSPGVTAFPLGTKLLPERIEFPVALSKIKYLRVVRRPIHTITFHNVALEPNPPGTGPAATVANTDQPAGRRAGGWR